MGVGERTNFLHNVLVSGTLIFQQRLFMLSLSLSLLRVKDKTGTSKYLSFLIFQCKYAVISKL